MDGGGGGGGGGGGAAGGVRGLGRAWVRWLGWGVWGFPIQRRHRALVTPHMSERAASDIYSII